MGYTLVQQQRLLAYPMGAADYQTDTRLSFLNVSKVQTELGAKADLARVGNRRDNFKHSVLHLKNDDCLCD